jgi:hypothetical protein
MDKRERREATMPAKEFITYPRPLEITALPVEKVLPFLVSLWDKQYAADKPDFDRLFGAGQLARIHAIAGVEPELQSWLNTRNDSKGWDVVSCFLMGFWRGGQSANVALVDLQVEALETRTLTNTARDVMICALAAAYDGAKPESKERIAACFKRFLKDSEPHEYQDMAAAALKYVLRTN